MFLVAGEFINTSIIISFLHVPLSETIILIIGFVGAAILVYLEEFREKLFEKKSFFWWIKTDKTIEVQLSPADKALTELAITPYTELNLIAIANYHGTLKDLERFFPVECIREGKDSFHVWYRGTGGVAELIYDTKGKRKYGILHRIGLPGREDTGLRIGQSFEEVRKTDPDGEYFFTENRSCTKKSCHYTRDGYMITIAYDSADVICGITEKRL